MILQRCLGSFSGGGMCGVILSHLFFSVDFYQHLLVGWLVGIWPLLGGSGAVAGCVGCVVSRSGPVPRLYSTEAEPRYRPGLWEPARPPPSSSLHCSWLTLAPGHTPHLYPSIRSCTLNPRLLLRYDLINNLKPGLCCSEVLKCCSDSPANLPRLGNQLLFLISVRTSDHIDADLSYHQPGRITHQLHTIRYSVYNI